MPPRDTSRQQNLLHLTTALLIGFMLVALWLIYWNVLRAPAILARDDNPRLFEAERRLQRGRLVDGSGTILAESSGPAHNLQRRYPQPNASPAVGYYSFTHGTAGSEAGFDSLLRGETENFWADFWRRTLHQPQVGRDVRLALDMPFQETAVAQLNNHKGAIILLERPHDQSTYSYIRALASHPNFDANQLDALFDDLAADVEAPLLNRATQGQYQPGLTIQPFILAAAVEQGLINLNDVVAEPDQAVVVGESSTHCHTPPPTPATWIDVLHHGCPAPMQALANQLGMGGLDTIFTNFGLTADPVLEIATATTADEPLTDPLMAGIGQDNLSVTPLQLALAFSTFTGKGTIPQPQIATAVQDQQGKWQPWQLAETEATAVDASTARALNQALPQFAQIHELSVPVLSGPEGSTNGWYLGSLAAENSDWVVVVVVEDADADVDGGETAVAEGIGRAMLGSDN